jgi:hypothetical protein
LDFLVLSFAKTHSAFGLLEYWAFEVAIQVISPKEYTLPSRFKNSL